MFEALVITTDYKKDYNWRAFINVPVAGHSIVLAGSRFHSRIVFGKKVFANVSVQQEYIFLLWCDRVVRLDTGHVYVCLCKRSLLWNSSGCTLIGHVGAAFVNSLNLLFFFSFYQSTRRGKPTIERYTNLTAFIWTDSSLFMLPQVHGPQTINPYSITGRIKVLYVNNLISCVHCRRVRLKWPSFRALFTTSDVCSFHLVSDVLITPRHYSCTKPWHTRRLACRQLGDCNTVKNAQGYYTPSAHGLSNQQEWL